MTTQLHLRSIKHNDTRVDYSVRSRQVHSSSDQTFDRDMSCWTSECCCLLLPHMTADLVDTWCCVLTVYVVFERRSSAKRENLMISLKYHSLISSNITKYLREHRYLGKHFGDVTKQPAKNVKSVLSFPRSFVLRIPATTCVPRTRFHGGDSARIRLEGCRNGW